MVDPHTQFADILKQQMHKIDPLLGERVENFATTDRFSVSGVSGDTGRDAVSGDENILHAWSHQITDIDFLIQRLRAYPLREKIDFFRVELHSFDCVLVHKIFENFFDFRPKVVQLEVNYHFLPPLKYNTLQSKYAYEREFTHTHTLYWGCSLEYQNELMKKYGYTLIQLDIDTALYVHTHIAHTHLDNLLVAGSVWDIYKIGFIHRDVYDAQHTHTHADLKHMFFERHVSGAAGKTLQVYDIMVHQRNTDGWWSDLPSSLHSDMIHMYWRALHTQLNQLNATMDAPFVLY
eukprot:GDKI01034565.1.p1 GENE.GDKI01034565.1~~GDKI01034565.1.p1  ORF type:complete len:291 (+),score=77.86 GDKI01034565.1:827-1699(+)